MSSNRIYGSKCYLLQILSDLYQIWYLYEGCVHKHSCKFLSQSDENLIFLRMFNFLREVKFASPYLWHLASSSWSHFKGFQKLFKVQEGAKHHTGSISRDIAASIFYMYMYIYICIYIYIYIYICIYIYIYINETSTNINRSSSILEFIYWVGRHTILQVFQ